MQNKTQRNLSELRPGEIAIIEAVNYPDARLNLRLGDLGLRLGRTITCLNRSPTGGVSSYRLSHGTFALEDHITTHIIITETQS